MSMVGHLRFVRDEDIDRMLRDPQTILDLLDEEGTQAAPGWAIEIDKAWGGIHYLLTGTALEGSGPTAFLVTGGRDIGDVDVGYGPARAFSSVETKAIADALAVLEPDFLRGRFDAQKMTELEVYPSIWLREGKDSALGSLLRHYETLRGDVRRAANNGLAMLVYLS